MQLNAKAADAQTLFLPQLKRRLKRGYSLTLMLGENTWNTKPCEFRAWSSRGRLPSHREKNTQATADNEINKHCFILSLQTQALTAETD